MLEEVIYSGNGSSLVAQCVHLPVKLFDLYVAFFAWQCPREKRSWSYSGRTVRSPQYRRVTP